MKRRRPRRLDRPGAEPAYLSWLHSEPCVAGIDNALTTPHGGRIEAHHAGKTPGVAMRAPDRTSIALCTSHHRELTERRGSFRRFTREDLREWQDARAAESYARYLSAGNRRTG